MIRKTGKEKDNKTKSKGEIQEIEKRKSRNWVKWKKYITKNRKTGDGTQTEEQKQNE